MTARAAASPLEPLKAAADRALSRGDTRGARDLFQQAVSLAPERVDLWMGLAACSRALRDTEGALAATESALTADPRCFPALLMKGSLLEAMGEERQAATVYGHALQIAPPRDSLAEPTRRAMDRAEAVRRLHVDALASTLLAEIGGNGAPSSAAGRRARAFAEAIAGRRKIYHQEPVQFHYPGQPAIEFWEREEFPWLEAFEAHASAIRDEVLNVWAEGSPDLQPYVNYPAGVPLDQWAGLNRSLDWSAFHLMKDGARVEAHCRQCPATMAALALVDQPDVDSRSPAAMFSILKAHTRIPPHTGVANTRLVVHLPLIVPEGCGFRVGGETRAWREGEAWVFDDTIEHEAWNDSGEPRAILICDVWNPRLSLEEREVITRLLAALDRFNGGAGAGAGEL